MQKDGVSPDSENLLKLIKYIIMLRYIVLQGQENEIILISLVRSNKEKKIGYLSQRNRLCVAISRARCGLYLFGNQSQLASARVTPNNWKVGILIFLLLSYSGRDLSASSLFS